MKRQCLAAWKIALTSVIVGWSTVSVVSAQSSVQLYGQLDNWVGQQKLPGAQSAAVLTSGGMSTPYWGIKGAEDLGSGYRAVFALESFFRGENGSAGRFEGDTFFSRDAYVGIESPYGTVTAGRVTTPLFISTILFNPFADSYAFSPIVKHVYLGLGASPGYTTDTGVIGDSGWSNAVQYSSPDFNGFNANVTYAFGNTAGDNGSKRYSAQFLYFRGPFAMTGVYQYSNFNNAPGDLGQLVANMKSQGVAQVGLSYDLKYVKLFGQYMYTDNAANAGSGSSWHVNTAQAGVSVPVAAGTASASYASSRDTGGLGQTRNTWAVGYDYPLSKRTDVYVAYMNDHITDLSSGNTFGMGMRAKF